MDPNYPGLVQFRQGDILLERVFDTSKIPSKLKDLDHNVLAEGEKTGHAHRLIGGIIREDSAGNYWVSVTEPDAKITHNEHEEFAIPEGDYMMVRQRELVGDLPWMDTFDSGRLLQSMSRSDLFRAEYQLEPFFTREKEFSNLWDFVND